MREDKGNVRCDMGFGKNIGEVTSYCVEKGSIPNVNYTHLSNPMPTGDHWKVLQWVLDFKKKGQSVFVRVPPLRREFIKRAAAALDAGGFSMEITSIAARKFRDDNDLRMQRGKVFVFFSNNSSKTILPVENGDLDLVEPNEGEKENSSNEELAKKQ